MAKNTYLFRILFIPAVLLCYLFCGFVLKPEAIPSTVKPPLFGIEAHSAIKNRIEKLVAIYSAEVGVREKSGRNDGTRVEQYLAYVGLAKGNPWCAAFVCWGFGKAGIKNPRSGYSPALFPESKIVWRRSGAGSPSKCLTSTTCLTPPRAGDVFGIYFPEKARIAHVGFVDVWNDNWVVTVEGNTNEAGSREGDGVYRKRRLKTSLYRVARWE